MKIGTKSVLFGAHQFAFHPWFVAWAWWKLYGFPFDPRLWVAFFVHDLGYVGKPNMDGPEGETHPELGSAIMFRLFDAQNDEGAVRGRWLARCCDALLGTGVRVTGATHNWCGFTRYHSRFLAKSDATHFSRLCVADKLAIALTPAWLYLPMVRLTGEIDEYMALAASKNLVKHGQDTTLGKYASMNISTIDQRAWYGDVQNYVRRWAYEHRDGRADTWTPDRKLAVTDTGVWK